MLPADKCHVILSHTITYVPMLHLHYYPVSGKYFMPVESPGMCITVYWVYLFNAALKTSSNLTKTANTNSLPLRVLRHLKIATTS